MKASELLRELLSTSPEEQWQRADAPYRLLRIEGKDAAEFLHRLCSQDLLSLGDGEVKPAAFLDAKGKLQATCLVGRVADAFWLEVHAEQRDRLAALLERYHFTEKLTIAKVDAGPCQEHVWWASHDPDRRGRVTMFEGRPQFEIERRGLGFVRSHGARLGHVELDGRSVATRPLDDERAECLRLLAGFLRVGVETEPTTLALEADLDDHISTTKGCYTGQEIVARINTYGHTNRKACLLHLAAGAPITAAQPLHETEDQVAVGRVLHAVPIPGKDARLGIGYLPKDFQALGTKLALADGTAVEVIGYEPLPGTPTLPA
jgi:tRNA-modifying protein YgfZ